MGRLLVRVICPWRGICPKGLPPTAIEFSSLLCFPWLHILLHPPLPPPLSPGPCPVPCVLLCSICPSFIFPSISTALFGISPCHSMLAVTSIRSGGSLRSLPPRCSRVCKRWHLSRVCHLRVSKMVRVIRGSRRRRLWKSRLLLRHWRIRLL